MSRIFRAIKSGDRVSKGIVCRRYKFQLGAQATLSSPVRPECVVTIERIQDFGFQGFKDCGFLYWVNDGFATFPAVESSLRKA